MKVTVEMVREAAIRANMLYGQVEALRREFAAYTTTGNFFRQEVTARRIREAEARWDRQMRKVIKLGNQLSAGL